jgi:hypothetical protein
VEIDLYLERLIFCVRAKVSEPVFSFAEPCGVALFKNMSAQRACFLKWANQAKKLTFPIKRDTDRQQRIVTLPVLSCVNPQIK